VPTIDAPAPALNAVMDMLARHVGDREIRVMGSRVTGHAKPFSDLDLVVMGDEPLDLSRLGQLRDAFDESNLPFAVDIVEWASSSGAFRRIIAERAQLLRTATPPTDR
jgi:type I restriction enzyme S subunit